MDEDNSNSWLRRANYTHTVCHRLDSSKLVSFKLDLDSDIIYGAKSRPRSSKPNRQPDHKISNGNFVINKQRAVSPLPKTSLSESFKEAKVERKRFSTPQGRERAREKASLSKKDPQPQKSLPKKEKQVIRKDTQSTKPKPTVISDDLRVDMSKLFLGLRFAHGAHSKLYHGLYNDQAVAVKIIRVPDDDENGVLAAKLEHEFAIEVSLLSRLYHANVIKLIAACRNPPVYCIITEYLPEGSLRSYLHKLDTKVVPMRETVAIALDIARGMMYVHSQGVVHRDLKPENVLINEDFRMKLADFGVACREANCEQFGDDPGTYRWMAPEMIKRKPYCRKVDVYSFGLMLSEMVCGRVPYEEMNPIQAAFAVVNKNLRPDLPGSCPSAMRGLIEQCWNVQPEKRPEFWQIVKALEVFEASLNRDGTLNSACKIMGSDQKKGLVNWIQKLQY